MKVTGDFTSVNLATGNKTREIIGDGERIVETVTAKPNTRFLLELANALRKAKHQNVAEAMASGMLWAMFPDWYNKAYLPSTARYYETKRGKQASK